MTMTKKVCITTDCVCDLPEDMLEEYNIPIIYFYINTDHGCFKDMDEITSGNIVEYFENGGKMISTNAPFPNEFEDFFGKVLQDYDEIIHITITSTLSLSAKYATEAAKKFRGRVQVFDSGHLSTGIGHLVIKAAELVREGKSTEEILTLLDGIKDKVSTSFIAESTDYLYRTGRVSKTVNVICTAFKIHPVLKMKNGVMKLSSIQIGSYNRCVIRYIRKEMKDAAKIKKDRLFITHSSCTIKMITRAKKAVAEICDFEQVMVTKASATISSNCGANTIGVLFVRE